MPNDFHPTHNTAEAFLLEIYARQLATITEDGDEPFYCTSNMDDKELREAILDDIIAVTMWEKQHPDLKMSFDLQEMLRFVCEVQKPRIIEEMKHVEIAHLFAINDGQIRLIDNREVYQAAMDYAGAWYEGFPPPSDVTVLSVDREKMDELVKTHGSVEDLASHMAKLICMDEVATVAGNNTIN